MGIKRYKESDKAAKQAIYMPGISITRLSHTDYYVTIRNARNFEWQREWENNTSKLHDIKPLIEDWETVHNEVKLNKIRI